METEDLTRARNRLSAGRIRAMEKAPYLATALLSLEPRETPGLNTFAVDKRWVLYYDPQKCLDWSVDEIAAVWLHEISHVIRDHAERFTATGDPVANAEYFNIAADAAINSDLKDMGVLLPDADKRWYAEANPLYPKWRRNMTAEEMYVIAKKGKGKKQEEEKGKGKPEETGETEEKDSPDNTPSQDASEDSNNAQEESCKEDQDNQESSDSENKDSPDEDTQDDSSEDSGSEQDSDPSEKESGESSSDDSDENSDKDSKNEDDSDTDGEEEQDGGEGDSDSESGSDSESPSGESEEDGESGSDSGEGESESEGEESDEEGSGEGEGESDSEGSDSTSEASDSDSGDSESSEGSDAHDHDGNCGSGAHGVPQEYEVDDGTGFDPMEAEHMRRQVAQEISDYNERYGTVPGGMVRDAKKLLDPQVDWTEELLSYVRKEIATVVGQNDYTYSRPSRRGSQTPFILPSMRQQPPPEIVVILDTSGSMKVQEEIAQALGEMEVLIETAARHSPIQGIRIINCDAGANIPVIVSDLDEFEIIGGGGTDMRIGIQAAAELDPPAGIIITMTDGYTPWPREVPDENQDALYIALIIDSKKKSRGGQSQQRGWSTTGIPEWMHVIEVNTK